MKKYAGFRNGYVRVRIYGEQTERFLNLCRAREIRISDLRRESELSLTGCLQIRDFFRLAPIHRKTKVKIHILEKHGLPFFFYRSKKRKAFFLGLLLCAGLLLFLSGRLWEIDVEGNVRNSTPEILDFLETKKESGMEWQKKGSAAVRLQLRSVKNIRILRGYQQNWREPDCSLQSEKGYLYRLQKKRTNLPVILWQNAMVRS
ncbi:hypothetical protein RUMOBE_03149 [Blautia obeum ATCC 29174]|uniref:Sporulation protein YqfD n=1 Tax=Blautia obeum ATCC 29174 TaxID=411459 RepID=A5ZVV6_9FIRM|nr:hypothetical protein RUMOBE_03149 [Blautia obeum ATCC 29174]